MSADNSTSSTDKPWWGKNSSLPVYEKVHNFSLTAALTVIALIALFGGGIAWTLVGSDPSEPRDGQFASTEYPASINGVLARCGNIFVFDNILPQHIGVVPDNVYQSILTRPVEERRIPVAPMIVPVYGYMTEAGVPERDDLPFYQLEDEDYPNRAQVLRSMYDGTTVIWFNSRVSNPALGSIRSYLLEHPDVIAVEWDNSRPLPEDRNFAISTWGASQSCNEFYIDTTDEFIAEYPAKAPGANGVEPPEAVLDPQGQLRPIRVVP